MDKSQKIQLFVSIPDLVVGDVLQILTGDGVFYTIEMLRPETGEVNLKKEKAQKVHGQLMGSLTPEGDIQKKKVIVGNRLLFFKLPGEEVQALRVTQKVWLNHEIVLQ